MACTEQQWGKAEEQGSEGCEQIARMAELEGGVSPVHQRKVES